MPGLDALNVGALLLCTPAINGVANRALVREPADRFRNLVVKP